MILLSFLTVFAIAAWIESGMRGRRKRFWVRFPIQIWVVLSTWPMAAMLEMQHRGHLAQSVLVLWITWFAYSYFVAGQTGRDSDTFCFPRFWQLMRWPTVLTVYAMLACIFAAHEWGFSMQWWTA